VERDHLSLGMLQGDPLKQREYPVAGSTTESAEKHCMRALFKLMLKRERERENSLKTTHIDRHT
jgi:hypothetical protein